MQIMIYIKPHAWRFVRPVHDNCFSDWMLPKNGALPWKVVRGTGRELVGSSQALFPSTTLNSDSKLQGLDWWFYRNVAKVIVFNKSEEYPKHKAHVLRLPLGFIAHSEKRRGKAFIWQSGLAEGSQFQDLCNRLSTSLTKQTNLQQRYTIYILFWALPETSSDLGRITEPQHVLILIFVTPQKTYLLVPQVSCISCYWLRSVLRFQASWVQAQSRGT